MLFTTFVDIHLLSHLGEPPSFLSDSVSHSVLIVCRCCPQFCSAAVTISVWYSSIAIHFKCNQMREEWNSHISWLRTTFGYIWGNQETFMSCMLCSQTSIWSSWIPLKQITFFHSLVTILLKNLARKHYYIEQNVLLIDYLFYLVVYVLLELGIKGC